MPYKDPAKRKECIQKSKRKAILNKKNIQNENLIYFNYLPFSVYHEDFEDKCSPEQYYLFKIKLADMNIY